MSIIASIILGVVEGLTEFLPISSTGHLILTTNFLKISSTEFLKSFEIAIQLGAILAVVALYWKKGIINWLVAQKVLVAFIPTGIIGLIFYRLVKTYLLGNVWVVLGALFLGGIFLLIFEAWHKEKETAIGDLEKIKFSQAITLGVFQSLAIIPGMSRAAATIVGGLLLGLKRKTIVEFSFLLAIPTMAAATGLDLFKSSVLFSRQEFGFLLIGFWVSFLAALLAVKVLINYIEKHNFAVFGWYRIILALIAGWWFLK